MLQSHWDVFMLFRAHLSWPWKAEYWVENHILSWNDMIISRRQIFFVVSQLACSRSMCVSGWQGLWDYRELHQVFVVRKKQWQTMNHNDYDCNTLMQYINTSTNWILWASAKVTLQQHVTIFRKGFFFWKAFQFFSRSVPKQENLENMDALVEQWKQVLAVLKFMYGLTIKILVLSNFSHVSRLNWIYIKRGEQMDNA